MLLDQRVLQLVQVCEFFVSLSMEFIAVSIFLSASEYCIKPTIRHYISE